MRPAKVLALLLAACAPGCVSGNKVRADADVIRASIDSARKSGAMKCAPKELATAEANLEFALGDLGLGSSGLANEHIRQAEGAAKQALALTKDCGVKPAEKPVVVKIDQTDRDGDGIPDYLDKCPDQPEDKDGFQDEDGCPDLDNDGDGLVDTLDRCPNQPGPLENMGCPVLDRDGDGVPDHLDRCPDQPGPASNQGCPIVDRDGDGIPDAVDKCPDEPEDKDGFQDTDGCPDLDNDQDGIPDALDKCPNRAGPPENFGCPVERQYKMVVVKQDRIEIKKQIKFRTASAKILGSDSAEIIREVAAAMQDSPQIKRLRVEGHTDTVGGQGGNLRLSQRRAEAVVSALIKAGVDPARLEAVGYGQTRPIASNTTRAGRAENRRTEFNIVEQ